MRFFKRWRETASVQRQDPALGASVIHTQVEENFKTIKVVIIGYYRLPIYKGRYAQQP
jgi:hypothetical protein